MFRVTRSNRRLEGQFWTQEWTRERVRSGAGYVDVVGVPCNRGMASAAVCGKPQAGWTRRIWNNHLQPEYIIRAIYFGLFRFCFHDLVEQGAWRGSRRSVDRKSEQRWEREKETHMCVQRPCACGGIGENAWRPSVSLSIIHRAPSPSLLLSRRYKYTNTLTQFTSTLFLVSFWSCVSLDPPTPATCSAATERLLIPDERVMFLH